MMNKFIIYNMISISHLSIYPYINFLSIHA